MSLRNDAFDMNERNPNARMARELISPHAAAELLPNTSYQAVLRWIRDGKLPAVTLPSGRRFLRRSDIEALLVPTVVVEGAGSPEGAGLVAGEVDQP